MKIMKIINLIIFSTLIFLIISSENISLAQVNTDSQTEFATIDVLVVIYSNSAGTKILASDISKLKNGIALAREFIWRNSYCQLNLKISYLEINEFKPKNFFPKNGLLFPEFVENDFSSHGIQKNQYGIILLIYGPPKGGGNYGGMKILGETGYSFFCFPCRTSVSYPGKDPNIDYAATWLFTHEIQHSIDLICYQGSDVPEMWHGDKPLDYSIKAGEQFSYQAEIFRNFDKYLEIKAPWGRIDHSHDLDEDGFPDEDSRIPMDEKRYHSDPTKADTDNDGLNDIQEFTVGIYSGADPKKMDTDGDGANDKNDIYPLHKIKSAIPQLTPQNNLSWDSWYLISNQVDFSSTNFLLDNPLNVKIYLNWEKNFLHFGCEMDAPAEMHLDIDFQNNGWWHGKDNYRLVVEPFSDRFKTIRVMDATDNAREFCKQSGKGYFEMWDDEPEYIAKFGKILDEFTIDLKTEVYEDKFLIRIKIPNNNRVPFLLEKNHQIGLRIYFTATEIGSEKSLATVFEQYEFFTITLK